MKEQKGQGFSFSTFKGIRQTGLGGCVGWQSGSASLPGCAAIHTRQRYVGRKRPCPGQQPQKAGTHPSGIGQTLDAPRAQDSFMLPLQTEAALRVMIRIRLRVISLVAKMERFRRFREVENHPSMLPREGPLPIGFSTFGSPGMGSWGHGERLAHTCGHVDSFMDPQSPQS